MGKPLSYWTPMSNLISSIWIYIFTSRNTAYDCILIDVWIGLYEFVNIKRWIINPPLTSFGAYSSLMIFPTKINSVRCIFIEKGSMTRLDPMANWLQTNSSVDNRIRGQNVWHSFWILLRTYAVEPSKLCNSATHRRRTPFPTPDESGNYGKVLGL